MVRAALVQFSGHESKEINVRKAEDLARQAAGNGARIIVIGLIGLVTDFAFKALNRKLFPWAQIGR